MIFTLLLAAADPQLAQSAEALFIDADKTYARELVQRLSAENPYERLYALRRLRALPASATQNALKSVAAITDDFTALYDTCFETGCPTTSVGEQALLVLQAADPATARKAVIEQVVAKPASARAFGPIVEQLFGDSASEIVTLVKQAKNTDQQAALLLLGSGLRCANNAYDAAQLGALLQSQAPLVRFRAALVVLQRTDGCEHQQAPTASGYRARATGVLEEAIKLEQPPSALEDLARIGTSGSPMMYSVANKLPQLPAIDALAAMKFRARPVAYRLTVLFNGVLTDPQRVAILKALTVIKPPLEVVRDPVLRSLQANNSPPVLSSSLKLLAELEAPVSASELELLSRMTRTQCKDSRSTDCSTAEQSLVALGRRVK